VNAKKTVSAHAHARPGAAPPRDDLQDLYNRFDGTGDANARLAWYGQCRAKGMDHEMAIFDTAVHFQTWTREVWPKRGIPLPASMT